MPSSPFVAVTVNEPLLELGYNVLLGIVELDG
jgi:hypothetical protein